MMNSSSRVSHIYIVLSLSLAVICYYIDNHYLYNTASLISEIFVKLLKMVSIPMIFLSIVTTLSGLDSEADLLILSKKIALYTLMTTMIAATIALVIYHFIDPSKGLLDISEGVFQFQYTETTNTSLILDMIPSNMIQTFLDSNVIGIVIIAFLIGISAFKIETDKRKLIHTLFSGMFEIMLQIASMILKFLPFAIWAFVLNFLHNQANNKHTEALFWYVVCIAAANALQAFVILPTLLSIKGISSLETARASLPALLTAFLSKSSSATMPATLKCVENLGVSRKIRELSIPMCTTINMNACAAFILITVLFVAEANGYVFSTFDFLMWIILATVAAIGNAGVPMGCYFMSVTYLMAMKIPLNIMGLILPIYTVIDMFETAINVWSDICITRIVDKNNKPPNNDS